MIVRLTQLAKSDLEEIATYIAQDDISRALSFTAELRAACEDLAERPTRFPLFDNRGVRRRLVRNYLIFFRITDEEVRVTRILHGARDYPFLHLVD